MGMIVLAGAEANLLRGTGAILTCSPAADANFPLANLVDNRPGIVFRYGSLTADPLWTVDLGDGLGGAGGLEAWSGGSPTGGWAEANHSGGDVVQDTVDVHGGTSSAKFVPGAGGDASLAISTTVRTGRFLRLGAWMHGTTPGLLVVRVQDLKNGLFLTSGGAWQVASANCITQSSASYAEDAVTFQVQSFETLLATTTTLRITFFAASSIQTSWLDDVTLLPGVDFISVHGHNVDPVNVLTLRSSTDAFAGVDTVEATLTPKVDSFYAALAARVYRRHWRLKATGTNTTASGIIYQGEALLGQALRLQQPPGYPMGLQLTDPRISGQLNPWGGSYDFGLGQGGMAARLPLTFGFHSEAALLEFQREVFERSAGGRPLVIVPDDTKASVYFVKAPATMAAPRTGFTFYDVTLDFVGMMPTMVLT